MANNRLELCKNTAEARGKNQAISKTKGGSIRKYIWPLMSTVCL